MQKKISIGGMLLLFLPTPLFAVKIDFPPFSKLNLKEMLSKVALAVEKDDAEAARSIGFLHAQVRDFDVHTFLKTQYEEAMRGIVPGTVSSCPAPDVLEDFDNTPTMKSLESMSVVIEANDRTIKSEKVSVMQVLIKKMDHKFRERINNKRINKMKGNQQEALFLKDVKDRTQESKKEVTAPAWLSAKNWVPSLESVHLETSRGEYFRRAHLKCIFKKTDGKRRRVSYFFLATRQGWYLQPPQFGHYDDNCEKSIQIRCKRLVSAGYDIYRKCLRENLERCDKV